MVFDLLILMTTLTACGKAPISFKILHVVPAAVKGDNEKVHALQHGADSNERDGRGYPALLITAEKGYTNIVQALYG
jgi:hypothetical protein